MSEESLNKGERSQLLLVSTISSLMNCCCTMLTSFYPVQVDATPISVTKMTHVNVEFCTKFAFWKVSRFWHAIMLS